MAGLLKKLISRISLEAGLDPAFDPNEEYENENKKPNQPIDDWTPPEVDGSSVILDPEHIHHLDRQLPKRLVCSRWILAFSTEQHGFSLANLYRIMNDWQGPTLLAITDTQGHRFGAFVTDSFRPDGQVRGGGECFVYRLKHADFANQFNKNPPNCGNNRDRKEKTRQASVQSCEDFVFVKKTEELLEMDEDYFSEEGCTNQINLSDDETHQNPATPIGETNQIPVSNSRITEYDYSSHKVWRWAQEHNCFIHGQADSLQIGLHDGKMSLWLDDNIERGRSEASAVFNNEPLAPSPNRSDGVFEVVNAEVWIFKQ